MSVHRALDDLFLLESGVNASSGTSNLSFPPFRNIFSMDFFIQPPRFVSTRRAEYGFNRSNVILDADVGRHLINLIVSRILISNEPALRSLPSGVRLPEAVVMRDTFVLRHCSNRMAAKSSRPHDTHTPISIQGGLF